MKGFDIVKHLFPCSAAAIPSLSVTQAIAGKTFSWLKTTTKLRSHVGRAVALTMLLANCAGMQSAGIRDNMQAMRQACAQQMQADRELDPIRDKVQLMRSTMEGAPPPGILADHSTPTAEEKAAIAKWAPLREECAQGAIRYSQSLSLPPNQIPARDKSVLLLRKLNEQIGLLIAALYEGRLTYSEFAAERMRVSDQFVAAVSGTPSLGQASEQVMPGELGNPPSRAVANAPELREGNEVTLQRRGNSSGISRKSTPTVPSETPSKQS